MEEEITNEDMVCGVFAMSGEGGERGDDISNRATASSSQDLRAPAEAGMEIDPRAPAMAGMGMNVDDEEGRLSAKSKYTG